MKRFRITSVRAYNHKDEVILHLKHKGNYQLFKSDNIAKDEEHYYQRYKRLGLKLAYVEFEYKEIDPKVSSKRVNTFKVNPLDVYKYMVDNPTLSLKEIADEFMITSATVLRYRYLIRNNLLDISRIKKDS